MVKAFLTAQKLSSEQILNFSYFHVYLILPRGKYSIRIYVKVLKLFQS